MPKELPLEIYYPNIRHTREIPAERMVRLTKRGLLGISFLGGLNAVPNVRTKLRQQWSSSRADSVAESLLYSVITVVALGARKVIAKDSLYPGQVTAERVRKEITNLIEDRYGKDPATSEQIQQVVEQIRRLTMLPPVGAKIARFPEGELTTNHYDKRFAPSFTAEETGRKIIAYKQAYPAEAYLCQFSVQGRMIDDFKAAALGLIMASPVANDWEQPAISTPWGRVGPLIHDGGNTGEALNYSWRHLRGRTDFINRVYVENPDKPNNPQSKAAYKPESLYLGEIAPLSLTDQQLYHDLRFYQRAAFAAYCAVGRKAEHATSQIVESGASIWHDYTMKLARLAQEYELTTLLKTPWFTRSGRLLFHGNYGARFEADGEPILLDLTLLEEIKEENPSLIRRAADLNNQVTQSVNQSLGII